MSHRRPLPSRAAPISILCLHLCVTMTHAQSQTSTEIDRATLDAWSAPYRDWHYWPDPVIPAEPRVPGYEEFKNTDCPTIYQLPEQPDRWLMSFIGFNGKGYNSFVAESDDLLHWTAHPEPLYKAGGHPDGLDRQYAHKISLVYNPHNETFYMHYCATGNKGRCIGLLTSRQHPPQ